jgi:hypothetical protein
VNTDPHDHVLPVNPYPHLPVQTPHEVLRREAHRLEVPEGTEQLLCPGNREQAGRFFRTQIQSYADLQALGFVPRRLAEDKVRQAVADDDRAVFERVSSCAPPPALCNCNGGDHAVPLGRTTPLRQAYNTARKSHHPALSRLLSDHLGTAVEWDAPLAATTRRWLTAIKARTVIVGVLLQDIVIHRNAQLSVAASAKSLMAHDIFIHRTGRLVQQGGYLRVWANSIRRFNDFVVSPELLAQVKRTSASWLLND